MNEIKEFNRWILLITMLSYAIITGVFNFIFPEQFHWSLLVAPALLATVTILLHRKLLLSSLGRPQRFINMFMAATGIKLMLYLFFILAYVLLYTDYAIPFIVIFFTLYITYTFLEIVNLLKFLKTLK